MSSRILLSYVEWAVMGKIAGLLDQQEVYPGITSTPVMDKLRNISKSNAKALSEEASKMAKRISNNYSYPTERQKENTYIDMYREILNHVVLNSQVDEITGKINISLPQADYIAKKYAPPEQGIPQDKVPQGQKTDTTKMPRRTMIVDDKEIPIAEPVMVNPNTKSPHGYAPRAIKERPVPRMKIKPAPEDSPTVKMDRLRNDDSVTRNFVINPKKRNSSSNWFNKYIEQSNS